MRYYTSGSDKVQIRVAKGSQQTDKAKKNKFFFRKNFKNRVNILRCLRNCNSERKNKAKSMQKTSEEKTVTAYQTTGEKS